MAATTATHSRQTVPLTDAIAIAVSELVSSERPPSHDQLTRLFARAGLASADPKNEAERLGRMSPGKLKRARAVLTHAIDANREAGSHLVSMILEAVRAGGGFRPESPSYIGEQALQDVRDAFRSEGYELDADGVLRPALLDSVDEADLPDALRHHVKRIRRGATDAALVTGEGKDFLEATARIVVVQKTGTYNERVGFPGTLYQAFDLKGLATPPVRSCTRSRTTSTRTRSGDLNRRCTWRRSQ